MFVLWSHFSEALFTTCYDNQVAAVHPSLSHFFPETNPAQEALGKNEIFTWDRRNWGNAMAPLLMAVGVAGPK